MNGWIENGKSWASFFKFEYMLSLQKLPKWLVLPGKNCIVHYRSIFVWLNALSNDFSTKLTSTAITS